MGEEPILTANLHNFALILISKLTGTPATGRSNTDYQPTMNTTFGLARPPFHFCHQEAANRAV
jgi:hypothetical protein